MSLTRQSINILYGVSFIDFLGIGLMFPLFQPHLRSLGASHLIVGIFGSTYSGLQVISGPLVGSWSDIRGHKFVFVVILLLSSLFYFGLGLSSSLVVLYGFRVLLGLFKHSQVLCRTLVGDLVGTERHAEVYGRLAATSSLGFVVGPVLGGYLSELPNGFSYVCCLTSILFVVNAGLISFLPTAAKKSHHVSFSLRSVKTEIVRSARDLWEIDWKVYWDTFTLRFLFGFAISIAFSQQSLLIKEKYNLSQVHVGYMISFLSIIGSLSGFALGFIKNRFYQDDVDCLRRLLHSFIMLTLSLFFIYYSSSLALYLLLLIPFAISNSILRIATMEVMLSRSNENKRGSISGASTSVMSVARSISPIASGIVADLFGENSVVLIGVVSSLMATALCVQLISRKGVLKRD